MLDRLAQSQYTSSKRAEKIPPTRYPNGSTHTENHMKSKNSYVRLLNFMRVSNHNESGFEGCEDIMAYMHEAAANGKPVKITDLVQSLQFGTGPTVHRKVVSLQKLGLISVERSATDARAKSLVLSEAGLKHLDQRSKSLKAILQG